MKFYYLQRCVICGRPRLWCRAFAIAEGNLNFLRNWRHWFMGEEG